MYVRSMLFFCIQSLLVSEIHSCTYKSQMKEDCIILDHYTTSFILEKKNDIKTIYYPLFQLIQTRVLTEHLPPLSIYFPIFSPFYFFLSFIGFTYFLLLSIPSLSTRIVPLRFQARGCRRRPNLVLVSFFCV